VIAGARCRFQIRGDQMRRARIEMLGEIGSFLASASASAN
jgi:hypothetical protein